MRKKEEIMTQKKGIISSSILAALGLLTLLLVLLPKLEVAKESNVLGSVTVGNGYFSTTTASVVATTWTEPRAVTGTTSPTTGILGSVVFTKKTEVTTLNIYDATTTDVTKRKDSIATSSILMASFGTSTAVGTYVFDTVFTTGLLIDPTPITGNMVASTTITWRLE